MRDATHADREPCRQTAAHHRALRDAEQCQRGRLQERLGLRGSAPGLDEAAGVCYRNSAHLAGMVSLSVGSGMPTRILTWRLAAGQRRIRACTTLIAFCLQRQGWDEMPCLCVSGYGSYPHLVGIDGLAIQAQLECLVTKVLHLHSSTRYSQT